MIAYATMADNGSAPYLSFRTALVRTSIFFSIISLVSRCCLSIEIDRTFLSGVADTTQIFHVPPTTGEISRANHAMTMKRHHLVCFHRGGPYNSYASTIAEGREQCCYELYLNGLIQSYDEKYCLDHVAMVPDKHMISAPGEKMSIKGDLMPAFYLAHDDEVAIDSKEETLLMGQNYNQNRQLKVYEDKERETLRDGAKGVAAFSPFHLTNFMSDGLCDKKNNGSKLSPLRGNVKGTVSTDGGMHRSFHQTMRLSLNFPSSSSSSVAKLDNSYRTSINATIFLPIMESVFVYADDPLLVEYGNDSPEGVSCKVSIDNEMIQRSVSKCNIQFVHPETIDIEQPSFASRQYIVAYQVSATIDLSVVPIDKVTDERELEIVVDYGTTLHIRYPPPITNETFSGTAASTGSVPISIQQPILYSASMSLQNENESSEQQHQYILQTDVTSSSFDKARSSKTAADPITIHVAAGLDSDYWWVTVVTMSSALIGGLLLMKSLDSVSIWC